MSNECWAVLDVEELDLDYSYVEEVEEDGWFDVEFCMSYRDPTSPEWILARGYWNNQWEWIDNETWKDS